MTKNNKPYPLLKGVGVMTTSQGRPALVWDASVDGNYTSITVSDAQGDTETYSTSRITVDDRTGRIEFVSDDVTYRIRELRETDGSWLSITKTDLPTEALRAFASLGGNMNPDETLDAYALDDSVYIVGLVYSNPTGRWSRVDGEWILLASGDTTFEGMSVLTIDDERAQAFLSLYDQNHVTITDAEQYESANQDEAVALSEENPTK